MSATDAAPGQESRPSSKQSTPKPAHLVRALADHPALRVHDDRAEAFAGAVLKPGLAAERDRAAHVGCRVSVVAGGRCHVWRVAGGAVCWTYVGQEQVAVAVGMAGFGAGNGGFAKGDLDRRSVSKIARIWVNGRVIRGDEKSRVLIYLG